MRSASATESCRSRSSRARSDSPSTYGMVNHSWPAASPESCTLSTCGCCSRAASLISRRKRSPPSAAATVATAPLVAQGGGRETAVFAGGCFWGVDAVFRHVRGVLQVVSGYAGGDAATARYELVSTSTTGHAESVEVTYDAATVSYAQLLRVFFTVAHDPTQRDRQGPDVGTQYRSALFYTSP